MAVLCIVVVSVILTLCCAQQTSNLVNVTMSLGTVTGLHVVTGTIEYYSFRGIPYAKVTTRFKAPTPVSPWTSVLMATNNAPQCPQQSGTGLPPEPSVEDCLFINVYTPQLPQESSPKLPVMVFIHGGGFIVASGSTLMFGPEFFMAEKNVILVTFNYRLGAFGFLSTGTQDAQGNAGMKDQVEALKWVNREISHFGGDTNKITLFGESAGSESVVHHMLSPMSKGLFHRAIAESGTALGDSSFMEASTAREHATTVARKLGCNTDNSTIMVNCLSKISVSELANAQVNITTEQEFVQAIIGFTPVIETKFDEDVFLADFPVNVLNNLTEVVPLIIGTCKDEGMSFLPGDDSTFAMLDRDLKYFAPREVIKHVTADQLNAFGQQLRAYYFNNGPVNRTTLEGLVNVYTDKIFAHPTSQTVRNLVEKKSVVYLYSFSYRGNYRTAQYLVVADKLGYKGVAHGEDLGYLFYSSMYNNTDLTKTATTDYQTMQKMVKLWTAFAVTGVPSNSRDELIKNINWPAVTNASELTYLDMGITFTETKDYLKERMTLWDRLTTIQSSSAFKIKPTIYLTLFSLFLILKLLNSSL